MARTRYPLAATTATIAHRAVLLPSHRAFVVRLIGRGRCPLPLIHVLTRTYVSRQAALDTIAALRGAGIPTYRLSVVPLAPAQS
jgi:hypothetical protein